ncbi:MAG: hypothetical protein MUF31_04255 [Akkermansiaceae bacterium]|nr:hypothetical protein [Akkermansiaceae bacterium]
MSRFLPILLVLLLSATLRAQEAPAGADDPRTKTLAAIESQLPVLLQEETALKKLREDLKKALTAEEKSDLEQAITDRRARIRDIRDNIRLLASGIPEDAWNQQPGTPRTLNEEIQDVLSPAIEQLREATAGPREMSELREEIARWENRLKLADEAANRLATLPEDEATSSEIAGHLRSVRELWEERRTEATGELQALRTRLDERISRSRGLVETVSDSFHNFWRGRGFNLILALAAFLAVLLVGRRIHHFARSHNPIQKRHHQTVIVRLLDLLAGLLIALCATSAALLVLYVRADWLLLSLATILVVAILVSLRNSVIPYTEQIRTILNLGPVRHGERIIIDGLPWQVDTLGFYCVFSNPAIPDTRLRLPIREVISLRSRPAPPKESWFPCAVDDWVVLKSGVYGKVIRITPEFVVMLHLGGSRQTFPVAEFLALTPENLSKGFRVSSMFGIDYSHQAIATTTVPDLLTQGIQAAMLEIIDRDHLKNIKVEFAAAASSSLDFIVMADFTGDVASQRNVLQRAIQRACVDLSLRHGWRIPFPQLTLHQA